MEIKIFLSILFSLAALTPLALASGNETEENGGEFSRHQKALTIFQVVRFPNKICAGTGSYNGTCYTTSECTTKGGVASGSCASGFGVCCVFVLNCGGTTYQNCTYFQSSPTQPAGSCAIKICKCSSDICQIRLDFSSFVITGPTTDISTTTYEVGGSVASAAGIVVAQATGCLTDTFSLTGPAGSVPPTICGTNTGEHMYVDATDLCNTAAFQLGSTGIGNTIPTRSWNIKITQISCYDSNLAPSGCTQYIAGSTFGMIQSYNYANQVQLANQNQRICFRRERGYCRVCFSASATTDFAVSAAISKGYIKGSICCGYGSKGTDTKGYDCVMIPGASNAATKGPVPNSICGNNKGLVTLLTGVISKTVCTSQQPFQFNFLTDWSTMETITTTKFRGFKLTYFETTC